MSASDLPPHTIRLGVFSFNRNIQHTKVSFNHNKYIIGLMQKWHNSLELHLFFAWSHGQYVIKTL